MLSTFARLTGLMFGSLVETFKVDNMVDGKDDMDSQMAEGCKTASVVMNNKKIINMHVKISKTNAIFEALHVFFIS